MPVTEQAPYGKLSTEALGRPAGGPVNKRLAMAKEEYLPGNWLKRAKKINREMENEWRLENDKCKQITILVQLNFLIQLLKIMHNLAFLYKNTNVFNYFSIFKLWPTETN